MQAFFSSSRHEESRARSSSSVAGSRSEGRERGDDTHLALGLVQHVVNFVVDVYVEHRVLGGRQGVHDRHELERLWRKRARSGARADARDMASWQCGGPARGRRAAPACSPCFVPVKPFEGLVRKLQSR